VSERKRWIVKVDVGMLPKMKAQQVMKEIGKICREWMEHGPDPLVVPSTWELLFEKGMSFDGLSIMPIKGDGFGLLDACPVCRSDTSDIEVKGPHLYHCNACYTEFWFKEKETKDEREPCLCGSTPDAGYETHLNPKCPYYAT
jgi:hypothetical protein